MRKSLFRILIKTGLNTKLNLITTLDYGGGKYKIPLMGPLGYDLLFNSEDWIREVIQSVGVDPDYTFIDIGVNLGQTLFKVKCTYPGINYIGFEPNPICVYYANKLIQLNHFQHCKIYPIGLSNTNSIEELYLPKSDYDSAASIINNFRGKQVSRNSIFVALFKFSSICNDHDFERYKCILKIDVEGAELSVIESMQTFLDQIRPIIILEVLPNYDGKNKERLNNQIQLEKLIRNHGYKILQVIKFKKTNFLKFEPRDNFGQHSDINLSDYEIVPIENNPDSIN